MERIIICRTIFGSKLYGTDGPDSDTDYKSVFLPTEMEILTGKIPKTINMTTGKNNCRNSAEDIDHESFSLHYFMELLYQGQTVALDMLHGNKEEVNTPLWRYLKEHKHEFYTKNMKAFVGYARKQAAKYGVKGSRLDAAREALAFLMTQGDRTIYDMWYSGEIYECEHLHVKIVRMGISEKLSSDWQDTSMPEEVDRQQSYWEVCGKKMTFGGKASHYVDMLKKFYDNYGGRAKLAAANQGIDWKAISHAFRVAYQTKAILEGKGFSYPLDETQELLKIKNGDWDYNSVVAPSLDRIMDEIETLAKFSKLPEKVDVNKWNNWLAIRTFEYIQDEGYFTFTKIKK